MPASIPATIPLNLLNPAGQYPPNTVQKLFGGIEVTPDLMTGGIAEYTVRTYNAVIDANGNIDRQRSWLTDYLPGDSANADTIVKAFMADVSTALRKQVTALQAQVVALQPQPKP